MPLRLTMPYALLNILLAGMHTKLAYIGNNEKNNNMKKILILTISETLSLLVKR